MSRDPLAAQEMVRLTGQFGVPVIVVDGKAVIGFDVAKLERLLASHPAPASLGAAVADAAPSLAKRGARPIEGVLVGRVKEGSPAHLAGLRPGDVILALGQRPVRNVAELQQMLRNLRQGHRATLEVLRDGNTLTMEVSF